MYHHICSLLSGFLFKEVRMLALTLNDFWCQGVYGPPTLCFGIALFYINEMQPF